MKKSLKKLQLDRETVRHLNEAKWTDVRGGYSNPCSGTKSDYRACTPK